MRGVAWLVVCVASYPSPPLGWTRSGGSSRSEDWLFLYREDQPDGEMGVSQQ